MQFCPTTRSKISAGQLALCPTQAPMVISVLKRMCIDSKCSKLVIRSEFNRLIMIRPAEKERYPLKGSGGVHRRQVMVRVVVDTCLLFKLCMVVLLPARVLTMFGCQESFTTFPYGPVLDLRSDFYLCSARGVSSCWLHPRPHLQSPTAPR